MFVCLFVPFQLILVYAQNVRILVFHPYLNLVKDIMKFLNLQRTSKLHDQVKSFTDFSAKKWFVHTSFFRPVFLTIFRIFYLFNSQLIKKIGKKIRKKSGVRFANFVQKVARIASRKKEECGFFGLHKQANCTYWGS